jgi:hypothetical protein
LKIRCALSSVSLATSPPQTNQPFSFL